MTEQQVPMLMRLVQLAIALQAKEFKVETETQVEASNSTLMENVENIIDGQESWAGWAWSFLPSILPSAWDEDWNHDQEDTVSGHLVHVGFYVDNATVTFKVFFFVEVINSCKFCKCYF